MVQSLRSSKAVAWQQRVQRFAGAGMTLERFCKKEGVSVSSFYRWQRKVGEQPEIAGDDERTPAFRAVHVTSDATMAIQLAGGTRVAVPAANLDVVRAVLGEILRHDAKLGCEGSRC